MTALTATNGKTELSTELHIRAEQIAEQAQNNREASQASSTKRVYDSDWNIFNTWCNDFGVQSLPAQYEHVAAFIAEQGIQFAASTLTRRLAAIRHYHLDNGFESPTAHPEVKKQIKGIRRRQGDPESEDFRKKKKKAAATAEKIITMLAKCDTSTLIGKRDKALLLIGFAGAFRRSELAALTTNDIVFEDAGIRLHIRKSKTDQDSEGQEVVIPNGKMNTVAVLQDWLDSAGIESGYLFRGFYRGGKAIRDNKLSGRAIADLVQAYAKKSGFNHKDFGGHSLRSGFITTAAESGANVLQIKQQSRHKSTEVLSGYVRSANLYTNHAGASFL